MGKLIDESFEEQIRCPNCGMEDCYMTKYTDINTYLCFTCGYTTNSKMIIGSDYVEEHFIKSKNVSQFIKDIHFNDTERKLVWYPTVLQFPELGIIFPDPNGEGDWGWTFAKEVLIGEDEKEKFKIKGTDDYYKTKIDIENSQHYSKYDFKMACIDMGIIKQPEEN